MNEQQQIEIETKIAYQEDSIQQLNDVICRQQQQIDKLEAMLNMLVQRFNELSPEPDSAQSQHEIPPHY